MSDGRLTFDDGIVKLDKVRLPGVFKDQTISGRVKFSSAKPDGASGTVKVPMGWEDADITLVMRLVSDGQTRPFDSGLNCFEKLARIDRIFKGSDNGVNPKVYDIENPHTSARGIKQVVFSSLRSKETDENDVLEVHLSFVGHLPFKETEENKMSASDKAFGAGRTSTADPKADPAVTKDKTVV